jgi:hypothetical protein
MHGKWRCEKFHLAIGLAIGMIVASSVQSQQMEDDGVVAQNKMRMALNMLKIKECIKGKRLCMLHINYPLKKLTDRILLFPIQF